MNIQNSKSSSEKSDLLTRFKTLLFDFDKPKKRKYISSLAINYIKFAINLIEKNLAVFSDKLTEDLNRNRKAMRRIFQELEDDNFFVDFGGYLENHELLHELVEELNALIRVIPEEFRKPYTQFQRISISTNVAEALDKAVGVSNGNVINEMKRKKTKEAFKINNKKITEELTYIFWFSGLENENVIDDETFLQKLQMVCQILALDFKRLVTEKVLDDIDKDNSGTINVEKTQNFFKIGLTDPSFYLYFIPPKPKPKPQIVEEPSGRKSNEKKKPFIEEKKVDPIEPPARKSNDKKNIDEEKKANERKILLKPEIKFKNMKVDQSIKISTVLPMTVIEVNGNARNETFKVGMKIFANTTVVKLGNSAEKSLAVKSLIRFGRFSKKFQNADVTFGEGVKGISRKQFQIMANERITGSYQLVCTTPPPKLETCFKINSKPFKLREHNLIYLSRIEGILVQELYTGFDEELLEKQAEKNDSEDSDEETTSLYNIRKLEEEREKRKMAEIIARRKEQEQQKKLIMKPFVVLRGVKETSQSINRVIRLTYQETDCYLYREGYLKEEGKFVEEGRKIVENGFEFGKDWVFMDNIANTGAVIFFEPTKGWFIKGLDISDWPKSKTQTLVAVSTYDKILTQSESNPVVLEEGMVIHADGYSFLIDAP